MSKSSIVSITVIAFLLGIGFGVIIFILIDNEFCNAAPLPEPVRSSFFLGPEPVSPNPTLDAYSIYLLLPRPGNEERNEKIFTCAVNSAKKYKLPVSLVISLIWRESEFNPLAVSKKGAVGLMQVHPKWHPEKLVGKDLFDIEENIDVGCQILSEFLEQHNGVPSKALHAYLGKNSTKEQRRAYIIDVLETALLLDLMYLR